MADSNAISIRPAERRELPVIAALAESIWPPTYGAILDHGQIGYMLEMMYADKVLRKEFDGGIRFFLIFDGGEPVGFLSFGAYPEGGPGCAKLHKLYLEPRYHGRGVGSLALRRAEREAFCAGFRKLRLNVNRENAAAIRAYERNGFIRIGTADVPIGCGFEMNDFVMERELSSCARILCLGSLNLDLVYRLPHALHTGETLSSLSYRVGCGGKGANQSIAAARAGAETLHVGRIGPEGGILRDNLAAAGVDVSHIVEGSTPTGHAVILVDDTGNNSIVLHPGANVEIDDGQLDRAFAAAAPGDILLLQNETSMIGEAMRRAKRAGMRVAFNFAPFDAALTEKLPLELVDFLMVNEVEGAGLAGVSDPDAIADALTRRYPETTVVLTLGGDGALAARGSERFRAASPQVTVAETTAAGDTFIGYFLAGTLRGMALAGALEFGCRAAALSVSRPGAAESIPLLAEVEAAFGA